MTTNETDTSRATREREIFEAGFAACLGYGDNVAHHRGEQAWRVFNKAMDRIDTLYPATEPPQAPTGLPWRKGGALGAELPKNIQYNDRWLIEFGGTVYEGYWLLDLSRPTTPPVGIRCDGTLYYWGEINWWLPIGEVAKTIPTSHSTDQE